MDGEWTRIDPETKGKFEIELKVINVGQNQFTVHKVALSDKPEINAKTKFIELSEQPL
jgi:hypothetical protein